jgi:4-carboxymuconolactone decarboxylase
MGDIVPKLAELTDDVLFGDVWERPGLSKRDRSLVIVSALVAMNRPDQLRSHLARARDNGVTQEEAVEAITHLAFYAGWPSAITAIGVAREVFRRTDPRRHSRAQRSGDPSIFPHPVILGRSEAETRGPRGGGAFCGGRSSGRAARARG